MGGTGRTGGIDVDRRALARRTDGVEAFPGTLRTAPTADTCDVGGADESTEEQVRRRLASADAAVRSPRGRLYRLAKRALDLTLVIAVAPVAVPVGLVIGLIIRLESPGPAIFRQQRVGEGGRVISFCKFRTMYVDARERFPELYDYSYSQQEFEQLYYKPPVDPRNTRFGRAVRKTTLDELPNLINVLRGDCSLVGPRPELPEFIRYYTPEQLAKFTVTSGVTGLAQVSGRNNLSVQQQIALDVEYVRTQSFRGDLRLLFETLVAVVKRVGAE